MRSFVSEGSWKSLAFRGFPDVSGAEIASGSRYGELLARLMRDDEGQDIIEYALLAAFVSIAGYTLLKTIGANVNTIYTTVNSATSSAAS